MNTTISILAEIPEELHQCLRSYLDTHPSWDQDRIFAAALSLFLTQNGDNPARTLPNSTRAYLEALFQQPNL